MKNISALAIYTLLISCLILTQTQATGETNNRNILYVGGQGTGNYTSIQDAINSANTNDTIYIFNGTYHENILINKTITLLGENKNNTILDGTGFEEVINITANNVKIINLTIQNGVYGIELYQIKNSTIKNSIITNNSEGIQFYNSHSNVIAKNNITSNKYYGISIHNFENKNISSNNNHIYNNNFINNTAYDECTNIWDNGFISGGNYWYNYNGTDKNDDGFGDTPYSIPGGDNKDKYPLMKPYTNKKYEFTVNEKSLYFMLLVSMIVAIIFLLPIAYIWYRKQNKK